MNFNEDEKRTVRTSMLVHGAKQYKTAYFESDSYDKLRIAMSHGLPVKYDKRLRFVFCDKNQILRAGEYVIDKHFGNIDLRIPYANGDDLETQLVARFGTKPKFEQYDEIINYINNHMEMPKVTDIPVHLNTSEGQNGNYQVTWFYGNKIMDELFYRKVPVCAREINLFGPCDEDTKMVYVHEMSHALLGRNKGSYKNILNDESLPIFMEKVAALDLDDTGELLYLKNLMRLLGIKHNILDKEILEFRDEKPLGVLQDKTYIISTLHATALFDTYQKGSRKTRKQIDDSIGQVLMGNGTIEDVFDEYGATLEKGSRIIQKQIKQYR